MSAVLFLTDMEADDVFALLVLLGALVPPAPLYKTDDPVLHVHVTGAKGPVEKAEKTYQTHLANLRAVLASLGAEDNLSLGAQGDGSSYNLRFATHSVVVHVTCSLLIDIASAPVQLYSDVIAVAPMPELFREDVKRKTSGARLHVFHGFNWQQSFVEPRRFDVEGLKVDLEALEVIKQVGSNPDGTSNLPDIKKELAVFTGIDERKIYLTDKSLSNHGADMQNVTSDFSSVLPLPDVAKRIMNAFDLQLPKIFLMQILNGNPKDETEAMSPDALLENREALLERDEFKHGGLVRKFPALINNNLIVKYGLNFDEHVGTIASAYAQAGTMASGDVPAVAADLASAMTLEIKKRPAPSPTPGWADTLAVWSFWRASSVDKYSRETADAFQRKFPDLGLRPLQAFVGSSLSRTEPPRTQWLEPGQPNDRALPWMAERQQRQQRQQGGGEGKHWKYAGIWIGLAAVLAASFAPALM